MILGNYHTALGPLLGVSSHHCLLLHGLHHAIDRLLLSHYHWAPSLQTTLHSMVGEFSNTSNNATTLLHTFLYPIVIQTGVSARLDFCFIFYHLKTLNFSNIYSSHLIGTLHMFFPVQKALNFSVSDLKIPWFSQANQGAPFSVFPVCMHFMTYQIV